MVSHAVNYYTSDADMTSTPLTITPLRQSLLAHDEYIANNYTSDAVMTVCSS
jgi:hypothetical protein